MHYVVAFGKDHKTRRKRGIGIKITSRDPVNVFLRCKYLCLYFDYLYNFYVPLCKCSCKTYTCVLTQYSLINLSFEYIVKKTHAETI